MDDLAEWDFTGFKGAKIGVDTRFRGMNAVFSSKVLDTEIESLKNVYTNNPESEWVRGVRYCVELRGMETQTAAIMLATRLGASEVVVVGSDFEGSTSVVNANPDTNGCHPCAFGIIPPKNRYGTFRSSPVDPGFGCVSRFCEGDRVFIVGGGPSLDRLDLSVLNDEMVLGVNDAFQLECVDHMYFGDHRWGSVHYEDMMGFDGTIWTTSHICHPKVVKVMPAPNRFSNDNSFVAVNGNSGFGAMNVAALGGATTIVLLGFDMKPEGDRTNWHDNNISHVGQHNYTIYQQTAKQLVIDINRAYPDLVVLNANPDSAMQAFEKIDPDDVVVGLKR